MNSATSEMTPAASELPQPRGYVETAAPVAAISTFLFAILWSFLFAFLMHRSFLSVLPWGFVAGMFFGLSLGLTMAHFLQGQSAEIEFSGKRDFQRRLKSAISGIKYLPVDSQKTEGLLVFKPTMQAGLAAGKISVLVQDGEAIVVGPKLHVKKLLKLIETV